MTLDPLSQIKECEEGLLVPIKVGLRASKNSIGGWENGMLKVRLNAVPEKGEANQELISFLAKTWKLPKTSISIHSGKSSRYKTLLISGINKTKFSSCLDINC